MTSEPPWHVASLLPRCKAPSSLRWPGSSECDGCWVYEAHERVENGWLWWLIMVDHGWLWWLVMMVDCGWSWLMMAGYDWYQVSKNAANWWSWLMMVNISHIGWSCLNDILWLKNEAPVVPCASVHQLAWLGCSWGWPLLGSLPDELLPDTTSISQSARWLLLQ